LVGNTNKITDKYKECINLADDYLKNHKDMISEEYFEKLVETIELIKKEF